MDNFQRKYWITVAIGVFLVFIYAFNIASPSNFPKEKIITVPSGVGLYEVAQGLKQGGVIRSPFWFRAAAIVLGGERGVRAGDYYLPYPENVFIIAWRVIHGDQKLQTFRITIPEGYTLKEISNLFDTHFLLFDHLEFERLAEEGYLFPDTYFVPINATASSTLALLQNNFDRKIAPLAGDIKKSGHSLIDIIKIASILESEAKLEKDKKIISGILWKRLKLGMALQVDSAPNTYKYSGLPTTPISNPGLVSIEAAIHPTTSSYLYFLTGKDGKTYYAETFDEHKINVQNHL